MSCECDAWWRKCPYCGKAATDQWAFFAQYYWCGSCRTEWALCSKDSPDGKTFCHLVHRHHGDHKDNEGNTWK